MLQSIIHKRGEPLLVLDQLKLPHEHTYIEVRKCQEGWNVINRMNVSDFFYFSHVINYPTYFPSSLLGEWSKAPDWDLRLKVKPRAMPAIFQLQKNQLKHPYLWLGTWCPSNWPHRTFKHGSWFDTQLWLRQVHIKNRIISGILDFTKLKTKFNFHKTVLFSLLILKWNILWPLDLQE